MRLIVNWYKNLPRDSQSFLQVSMLVCLVQLVLIAIYMHLALTGPSRDDLLLDSQSLVTVINLGEDHEFHF